MNQQLRVIQDTDQEHSSESDDAVPSGFIEDERSLYERADDLDYFTRGREVRRFVDAMADEFDRAKMVPDLRVLDELETAETDDLDLGVLTVFPDETLMLIGSDPTAKDTSPLWALVIERHDPIPAPTTAQRAVDLLRPGEVRDRFDAGDEPTRQGEWFLLEADLVPVSSVHRPGVASRPFGPGPLDNHVPREYAFTVSDRQFVENVREVADALPSTVDSVPEVLEWFTRQDRKPFEQAGVPTWRELRECAGDILIRGTLRHREDDHYVEDVGDSWHRALTHDLDVYTADSVMDRVRLD